jgi:hypothetical protein
MSAVDQSLDELAEWVDGLLALGSRAASLKTVAHAAEIVAALHSTGLVECSKAISRAAELLHTAGEKDSSLVAEQIGRLCVALEIALEARRFDRWRSPETESPTP